MKRFLYKWVLRTFFLLLPWISLISADSYAAEFGVGVGISEYGSDIYLPVRISDNFKTEFSISFDTHDEESGAREYETDSIAAGVGLFYNRKVYDKTQLYFGCRFQYIYSRTAVKNLNYIGNSYVYETNGYGIAPAMGFEYFFTEHISLGGEAEIYYKNSNLEEDSQDGDVTSTGTGSRVVLRYYF